MNIYLCKMTIGIAKSYYKEFTKDPDTYMDLSKLTPYVYSDEWCERYIDRQISMNHILMAIMLREEPIGEVILKNIDYRKKCCTLSIHLQNDSRKNKGYGTEAERLALEYAFNKMKMETVFADAIMKNTRSQRVLEKVGFVETHRDGTFIHYCCSRSMWYDTGTANHD